MPLCLTVQNIGVCSKILRVYLDKSFWITFDLFSFGAVLREVNLLLITIHSLLLALSVFLCVYVTLFVHAYGKHHQMLPLQVFSSEKNNIFSVMHFGLPRNRWSMQEDWALSTGRGCISPCFFITLPVMNSFASVEPYPSCILLSISACSRSICSRNIHDVS